MIGRVHKLLSRSVLLAQRDGWRRDGKRVVFTNGCFDLIHAGHLSLLRGAAAFGDVLVVGINGDASVARLKGPGRPIVPEGERAALVAALECVDAAALFDEDTPLALLAEVRPDVLVKGAEFRAQAVVGRELVESWGGRLELVPMMESLSTTALLERIRAG